MLTIDSYYLEDSGICHLITEYLACESTLKYTSNLFFSLQLLI